MRNSKQNSGPIKSRYSFNFNFEYMKRFINQQEIQPEESSDVL